MPRPPTGRSRKRTWRKSTARRLRSAARVERLQRRQVEEGVALIAVQQTARFDLLTLLPFRLERHHAHELKRLRPERLALRSPQGGSVRLLLASENRLGGAGQRPRLV